MRILQHLNLIMVVIFYVIADFDRAVIHMLMAIFFALVEIAERGAKP